MNTWTQPAGSLGIGFLGAGRIGRMHARIVEQRIAGAHVAAVYDVSEAAAREVGDGLGVPVAASVDGVLASPEVDAVAICTSTASHADLIVAAAAAGKAVLCEKPVSLDLDEVDRALAAVEAAGVPFQIGFNRRFDPAHASVRDAVAAGAIGEPHLVRISSRDPAPPPLAYVTGSGGLFLDMMIHDFDMARFVAGSEVVDVYARGAVRIEPAFAEAGDIDTAVVIMETASGKVVQISNSRRATYGYDQRVEAHGANGMLSAANVRETTVEWAGAHGFTSDKALNFFLERYEAAYRNELDAFIGAAKAGTRPRPDGEDGLKALMLADAAYRSWKTNERVPVG